MNERFLILCRAPGRNTDDLVASLGKLGSVEVVSDSQEENAAWYPDEMLDGFHFLNGYSSSHRPVTAWERAWKHLELTSGEKRGDVWLVEDDVAGSADAFTQLVKTTATVNADLSTLDVQTRENDRHWSHWNHGEGLFSMPCHSFNPLCRLSERMVSVVLEFRRCHGRFIFQEVLFASLMAEHGFSYLDWQKDELTAPLFKSFGFRPELTAFSEGICHPVKNPEIHRAICEGRYEVESSIKPIHQVTIAVPNSCPGDGRSINRPEPEFPRITHQIWLGKNPFPTQSETWRQSLFTHLPDWEHRLWTDADLAELGPGMLCLELVMDESIGMGIRSDVMRYEILRQHGGLYLDHDVELLGPLDEIMMDGCVHFGYERPDQSIIGNAIIGGPQGHAFWEMLLRRIIATVPRKRPENCWDVVHLTGPGAFTEAVYAWTAKNMTGHAIQLHDGHTVGWLYDHADLVGWTDETVYPYYFTERETIRFQAENYPRAYVAHHWGQAWIREDEETKAANRVHESLAGTA